MSVTRLSLIGIPRGAAALSARSATVIGGNNASTRLMLPMNGGDGELVQLDEAVGAGGPAKFVAGEGGAALSRGASHFGVTSLYVGGGVGTQLRVAPHSDFAFAAESWSLDFWVDLVEAERAHLLSWNGDADNHLSIERDNVLGDAVRLRLRYRRDGVDVINAAGSDAQLVAGEWTHVALQREGTQVRLYLSGALHLSATIAADQTMSLSRWPLTIGANRVGTAHAYFEEVRVQMGVNFTGTGSSAFQPWSNRYTPTFTLSAGAAYDVKAATWTTGAGLHGLALVHATLTGSGAHAVLGPMTLTASGTAEMRAATWISAGGRFGLVTVPCALAGAGAYDVLAATSASAGGFYDVHAGTYALSGGGLFALRAASKLLEGGLFKLSSLMRVQASGVHRIENLAVELYELYVGTDAAPNFSAAPFATFASLPFTTAALTANHTYWFVLRKRNRYGLLSANLWEDRLILDAGGSWIPANPSAPKQVAVAADTGNTVRVSAIYVLGSDPAAVRADSWLIYRTTTGVDPNPGVDTPTVVAMTKNGGLAVLSWISPAASDGADVRVLVRTRRTGTPNYDSQNATIQQATADDDGPPGLAVTAFTASGGLPLSKS